MIVLGLHGGYRREEEPDPAGFEMHDAAAVLVEDGAVVAAIEEERLNRLKHCNTFPVAAARRCLEIGRVSARDLDCVAVNTARASAVMREKITSLWDRTPAPPMLGGTRLGALVSEALGHDVSAKLWFCEHHLAHAWSAFAPSGFDESLVLSLDGDGDDRSGMVLVGSAGGLRLLRSYAVPQSLGHLYQNLIAVIGYSRFDEYKVMALAPYGDPAVYDGVFSKCYELLPGGDYRVAPTNQWFLELDAAGVVAERRSRGEPFKQCHLDFAASLQASLERIVLHVLTHYRQTTGLTRLCLAGGVAHNCSLNGRILRSGLFDGVFVQPAAHDAGGALGAAWAACHAHRPGALRPRLADLQLGAHIGPDAEIRRALDAWRDFVVVEESDCVTARTARMLAQGDVVAWAQGRSEFGPRALGNRSILADPRPEANKRIINEMVKKREEYRPFAPAVLEERVRDYFEVPEHQTSFPFMIFVVHVRPEQRDVLRAVTHVDGSARVQTVSKATNPLFWDLLRRFEDETSVPILLNTSFNSHAEPIVDSVDDAVACLLTTRLNALVVGPFVVRKRDEPITSRILSLVPTVVPSRRLTKARARAGLGDVLHTAFAIESVKSAAFGPLSIAISEPMFHLLERCDGSLRASDVLDESNEADSGLRHDLAQELFELWTQRVVTLEPLGGATRDSAETAAATADVITTTR